MRLVPGRRLRLSANGRRALFFAAAFAFCLLALVPLRLALGWLDLEERGLSAREASGSVWLGVLREARFGAVEVGDLAARLRTLPLLVGRARVDLKGSGGERPPAGAVTVSRHGFGFDDVGGHVELGPLLAGLPGATLDLTDLSIHFADGLCRNAEGLVRAGFAGEFGGVTLPGALTGDARCDGGALRLPLRSQSGQERLDLHIFEDGRYRAELALNPGDPAAVARLTAAGFAPGAGGYVLRVRGSF